MTMRPRRKTRSKNRIRLSMTNNLSRMKVGTINGNNNRPGETNGIISNTKKRTT